MVTSSNLFSNRQVIARNPAIVRGRRDEVPDLKCQRKESVTVRGQAPLISR